ncbi:MAG: endonuclease domain-containing protein [Actinobacteria bacterium]|nr:endonuclease domain-containing protein [Actinomycetota bacterium]
MFPYGVTRYADLLRTGLGRAEIEQLQLAGHIRRVRRGWYADPSAGSDVLRAVRLGGALSCLSALRHHGVWVPPTGQLHIRMSEHHQAKSALPADVHVCPLPIRSAPTVAVDPLATALLAAVRCLNGEGIVVVLDSILNLRLLRRDQLASILSGCAVRVRRLVAEADHRAESGTESMVRFRLRRLGVKVRSQVFIEDVGRVDLLVGKRLVIEVDSRAHHTGESTYQTDRRRDLVLVARGRLVLRFTYHQIVHEWDAVLKELRLLIRSEAHLRPRPRAA